MSNYTPKKISGFTIVMTILIIILMVAIGWISWTIAPNEKIIYKSPEPKTCELAVGDKAWVEWGNLGGQVVTVVGFADKTCYGFTVKTDSGQYDKIPYSNLNKLEDKEGSK